MGFPPSHPEAAAAKAAVMTGGVIPGILARQRKEGFWETREDFYVRAKYRGTVWQFIILAELGAEGGDVRIKRAGEFILDISQDRQSGGFSYRGTQANGGYHSGVIPCLTGNLVWSLLRFSFGGDSRIEHGIDWITHYLRFDDGDGPAPKGWPYDKRDPCWGKHTCFMGIVKCLKALAEIPEKERSPEVSRTIAQGAEYLLRHHLFKRSHDLSRAAKPKWLKFGFPTLWDSNALEVLMLLTSLGYRDPRMMEAAELVLAKQNGEGKWLLENTFNGRFQVDIEQKGKPSKWVTLNAIRTLRAYFGRGVQLRHDPV